MTRPEIMQAIGQLVFQIKQEDRRVLGDEALIAGMKKELSFLRGLIVGA